MDANDTKVENNILTEAGGPGYGVLVTYANNNTIENNTATGNDVGIFIDPSDNNTVRGNAIRNNIYGISAEDVTNLAIERND